MNINIDINDINETGKAEPCYILSIIDASNNETTTIDIGNREGDPLTVGQGTYQLWIKMGVEKPPFKYPHLHVRSTKSKPPMARRWIPYFNTDESTMFAVVFRSETGPEKEQKIQTVPATDDKIPLGTHKLRPGDLNILLIGYMPLDFLTYNPNGEPEEYVTDFISVNLNFWLNIVDGIEG